jgi:hypothetical protein
MRKLNVRVRPGYFVAAALALLMVAGLLGLQFEAGTQAAQGGFFAAMDVTPNEGQTFSFTTLPAGPFSVEGTIQVAGGGAGVFRRAGTKLGSGFAVVTDVYELPPFRCVLIAQGTLSGAVTSADSLDVLAVTGGVGACKNVAGDIALRTTDQTTGAFRARMR